MPRHFDILIRNATIVDGTGCPRTRGSVGIVGDRIVAVGESCGTAARVIDGSGLVLAPGFVDPHSHGDLNILQYPSADNFAMQGITTFVGGHCGFSRAPLTDPWYADRWMYMFGPEVKGVDANWKTMAEFLRRVEDSKPAVNYAPLVGNGALRLAVMGRDFTRNATANEVREMEGHLREAMDSGAFGMSAGMDYESEYAHPESELAALCKVVLQYDGLYTPHPRSNSAAWPVSDMKDFGFGRSHIFPEDPSTGRYHGLVEAIEIAKASGVRLLISHLAAMYWIPQPHTPEMDDAIARATLELAVERPREQGLDVTFSVFACTFSGGSRSNVLNALYSRLLKPPKWLADLSREELVEKLKTRAFRDKMRQLSFSGLYKLGVVATRVDPYWVDHLRVATSKDPEFLGKTIGEVARERQPDWTSDMLFRVAYDVLFDLVVADPDATWEVIGDKRQTLSYLSVVMRHPSAMPLFDGISMPGSMPAGSPLYPPVWWGLFPYYIDTFVKQEHVLSLEQAIHQATAVPCETYRIRDRGVIREGAFADLILFDAAKIRMTGTFAKPDQPTDGMAYVMVNGQLAMDKGKLTGARTGKVLQHLSG